MNVHYHLTFQGAEAPRARMSPERTWERDSPGNPLGLSLKECDSPLAGSECVRMIRRLATGNDARREQPAPADHA